MVGTRSLLKGAGRRTRRGSARRTWASRPEGRCDRATVVPPGRADGGGAAYADACTAEAHTRVKGNRRRGRNQMTRAPSRGTAATAPRLFPVLLPSAVLPLPGPVR